MAAREHRGVINLSLDQVEDLSRRALEACGASAINAAPVADSMREAEAQGIRNVGLAYLPTYCEHLRIGKVDGTAVPIMTRTAPAAIAVDAVFGFAHPAFLLALDEHLAMAETAGVAVLAIRRSYSAGVVGWFVEHIARRGLVGLAFANASAVMPPTGGSVPVFGTDPLGFAAPRAGRPPIVLDMATSATARVNVIHAAEAGGPIPDGWALDAHGRPTTDPDAALAGMMAPLGGYKGSGLALMVEVLAAALTGSRFSFEASSLLDDAGGPPGIGQLFISLAPSLVGGDTFATRIEMLAAALDQPGARLPGDRRHEARQRAEREGVEVPDRLHAQLENYASSPGAMR